MFTDLKIPAEKRAMTRSERWFSIGIGAFFLLMMSFAFFEDYSPRKLSIPFLILFWIPMLVLHELGHAFMAKALGWRVREIVIGFGRDLWQWQIGETRIKIKLAPVEGYVLPAPTQPGNLRLKSMLVYAAGPGAELLLLAVLISVFGWNTVFNNSDEIPLIALQSLAVAILLGAGFNLLPFRTEGAVSDGLGILASPFMTQETIELRLVAIELREAQKLLNAGKNEAALQLVETLLNRFKQNESLQLIHASALSAGGHDDAARELARSKLSGNALPDDLNRAWLHLQARVELNAEEPSFLVLDLAMQKALDIAPKAPDLLATKGASLVLRGRNEEGGNILADAWRRNDGSADDAEMLCYLAIASHRIGAKDAAEHFGQSFSALNRSIALQKRFESLPHK